MKQEFFVAFKNKQAENPMMIEAVIPPVVVETNEDHDMEDLSRLIKEAIAKARNIPVEDVTLLHFQAGKTVSS